MKNQKIVAVIPALNEENTINNIIKGAKPLCDKIIVALAKNSYDRTKQLAESSDVEIIVDNGLGKGDGLKCATKKITEGIIIFIDADGSHITEDIPKLIKPIITNKADMVIGSRFLGGSEELSGSFNNLVRNFLSSCINAVINLRFKQSLTDTQNGFRAIKASVFHSLKLESTHTEIETEMTMKILKKGYTIVEVPCKELKRKYGISSISILRDGWRYLYSLIKNFF